MKTINTNQKLNLFFTVMLIPFSQFLLGKNIRLILGTDENEGRFSFNVRTAEFLKY